MKLVLNEMDEEREQFDQTAEWDPNSDDPVPDEFLTLYPIDMWEEKDAQWFIERIDGPYVMLTRVESD